MVHDGLIDVFGADHSGYVKRMKAAVKALSDGRVNLDINCVSLFVFTKMDHHTKCRNGKAIL